VTTLHRAEDVVVKNGVATLGPQPTSLIRLLDEIFAGWGSQAGAHEFTLPPILPVSDLAALEVYQNFPHLAMVATTLSTDAAAFTVDEAPDAEIGTDQLMPAGVGLPSAVCYGVYLHLRDRALHDTLVTAVGTCYRNEQRYEGLRRLGAFRMREVVALGSPEYTRSHIDRFSELVLAFATQVGLSVERQVANDPFFDTATPQALWQQVVPVKHEFVVDDLAVASVNEHRTFFGERCGIRQAAVRAPATSSCAAFGLERWVSVLAARYEDDWAAILEVVQQARAAVDTSRKD
jgi:hypothetical protein